MIESAFRSDAHNIEIIQCIQNNILRAIVESPCYVTNGTLQQDFSMGFKEVIDICSLKYRDRLYKLMSLQPT